MQALTMSCALPGIFMPTILDDGCYIDGGVMANYPLSYCLKDHTNPDEILGVTFLRNGETDAYKNNIVTNESNVIDFAIGFFMNAMNYIYKNIQKDKITNQVECICDDNFLTLERIQESINSMDMRKQWIDKGINDGLLFLEKTKYLGI